MSLKVVTGLSLLKTEKIINFLMKSGKKSVAKRIYADMLKEIKLAGHMNPDIVVETAIDNAAPSLMIKSKRM
jgi:small subunit ribosomal protein S7